jgi:hypothetical protein
MTEKFGGDIGRKYADIDLRGRKAVAEAAIDEFSYSPEEMQRRFNVAAQFEPASEQLFNQRVTAALEQAERDFGIKFIIAGRDFPLHTTLLEGKDAGDDLAGREKKFGELSTDLGDTLRRSLTGQAIEFKYLLIDKGNLILTSVQIPEEITAVRTSLDQSYQSHALNTLPMTNILHATVARMTQLPEAKETLKQYRDAMIKLRHDISADPLKLRVGDVYTGSTYDLLNPNENAQD